MIHRRLTIEFDVFPDDRPLCFVLLVQRHLDDVSVDGPLAHLRDESIKFLALEIQPFLEDMSVDLAHGLADAAGDTHPNEFLEAADVGDQIRVEVVAVERGPELAILRAAEMCVEDEQFLDRLCKRRVARGRGRSGRRQMRRRDEQMRREQVKAEREIRGGQIR